MTKAIAGLALGLVCASGMGQQALHWHMLAWDKVSDERAIVTYSNGPTTMVCNEFVSSANVAFNAGAGYATTSCVVIPPTALSGQKGK